MGSLWVSRELFDSDHVARLELVCPLGAMGNQPSAQDKPNPWGLAQGPWPPLWGEIHSREAPLGVDSLPGCSLCNPPGMAPPNLGSIAGHSLPIFTDFY